MYRHNRDSNSIKVGKVEEVLQEGGVPYNMDILDEPGKRDGFYDQHRGLRQHFDTFAQYSSVNRSYNETTIGQVPKFVPLI
jgi:hypothetical protein